MDFLKRSWGQVQSQLTQLNASQRYLIMALMVILLLVFFLVTQYLGQPDWVPITKFAGDRQSEAVSRLKLASITTKSEGTNIFVSATQYADALAVLQQADMLADNTAEAFDEMMAATSPWDPTDKTKRAYLMAKQKVLGAIIGKMKGVRSADVIIATPEDVGFGKNFTRPSGSVSVVMQGSGRVGKPLVEAIAGLVASAVAEMTPQDVVVIDANIGRQFTVKNEDDIPPDTTIELMQKLEEYHADKIKSVLGYIPGVVIAVNVQTDDVQRRTEKSFKYDSEPLMSQRTQERVRENIAKAAEGGARPNTGLDIETNAPAGSRETENTEETTFREKPLTAETNSVFVGRKTKQINVTINVPRRYFVQLWRQQQPAANAGGGAGGAAGGGAAGGASGGANPAAADPTDADLTPIRDVQLAQITAQVEPLIIAGEVGVIRAHMTPDETVLGPAVASVAAPTGVLALVQSGWMPSLSVGALAVVAMTMMLLMVRRATRIEAMPTAEELAGVPPKLPTDDDLVGEASEADATLAGVELDEEELRYRKIAEQISDMIKANPNEAGAMIGRWVRKED
jgi:flagellar M-ring protein FliF